MSIRTSAFDTDLVASESGSTSTRNSRFSVDSVMQSIRNIATLSEALRILGAGVILASMSVFLMQGWSGGNDISRYLLLLAQTGLLGAAGFAMSHVVKETKGARLFFGLALVSIPANFTILGALLYSVFQWDGGLATYPGFADWRIEDVANIGITMGAALLVLVPMALFCFAIMARHSAKPLALNFLLLNAMLLLPIRSSLAAGVIALTGVVYALFTVAKLLRKDRALKTGEGKFALMTLFIPLGIILFRSMYFYQVDSLMIAMLAMVLFLVARQASLFPDRNPKVAVALELLSWPLAMVFAVALTDAFASMLATGLAAPLFALAYSALALDIIRRTGSRSLGTAVRVSITIAIALSFSFSVVMTPTGLTALLSVVAGTTLLLWGAAGKQPGNVIAGIITVAAGVLFGLEAIVQLVVRSSWIDLAVFGASAIALGSLLDRHGVAIRLRLSQWYGNAREDKEESALEI
ncbi:MAG: hypothetical protein QNJ19_06540 [Woeseiaceae bacterium]|nr:hypothetical protein [Woeseiaceae bacterium]